MNSRFTKAAAARQAALDYIITHPGAYAPQIIAALGWHKSIGADRLRDMADNGEVSRTQAVMRIINSSGVKADVRTHTYLALVETTRSPAEVVTRLATNLGKGKAVDRYKMGKSKSVRDEKRPGVHIPDMPIRNQGGQGAVRHEIRRGCSLS